MWYYSEVIATTVAVQLWNLPLTGVGGARDVASKYRKDPLQSVGYQPIGLCCGCWPRPAGGRDSRHGVINDRCFSDGYE